MTSDQVLATVREAAKLPMLSPSAPYEIRAKAIERSEFSPKTRWWEVYPEGHMAAFVFRVWRALGIDFWEPEGFELPQ